MMSGLLRCIVKQPGQAPEIAEIPNTLKASQEIVGGYIDIVRLPYDDTGKVIDMIIHDEGLLLELEPNIVLNKHTTIVGPVIFTSSTDCGDQCSLSDEEIASILSWLLVLNKEGRA
jgi:hypothetical protein